MDCERNRCKMFVTHSIYYNLVAEVIAGLNLGATRKRGIILEKFYLGWGTFFIKI